MLGKKSSVAPILAFLKENNVSTVMIHKLHQNKIMVAHVAQTQKIYLAIFFLGVGGRVRSGRGFGREAWTTGSSGPIPPHQVELRKPSDRAIM